MLEDPRASAQVDCRQKLLQSLVLFPLEQLFAALGFLQSEIILKPPPYRIVERELQRLVRYRVHGYAAIERIRRRTRIESLRARSGGQSYSRSTDQTRRPNPGKISTHSHVHYFLR